MMIKPGDVVKGPYWDEPVRVNQIEPVGDYIRLVGITKHTNQGINNLFSPAEIQNIELAETQLDFAAPPEETFFLIEATRFKYASLFDPLLAMSVSRIDPLPFQIEGVYGYILRQP